MCGQLVPRAPFAREAAWSRFAVFLLVVAIPQPSAGQTSVDSLRRFMPFNDAAAEADAVVSSSVVDITRSLAENGSAAFLYDFNAFGWPSAWSTVGISPHHIGLRFNGIPFEDLVTGSPRYDLLPTALLKAPEVSFGYMGAPVNVRAEVRQWAMGRPLTELHYQTGDYGLQRVTALHAQSHQRSLLGQPGRMQTLFAYAGAAAKGEYPGSRLQRFRQLLLRTRYQQTDWSLELLYLHNQRRLGAHGGVLGTASERYNRLIALVRDSAARRRLIRNDFMGTLHVRPVPGVDSPLALTLFANTQTLRHTSALDSVTQAVVRRGGLSVSQRLQVGSHQLRLQLEGWIDRGARVPDANRRAAQHLSVVDSLTWRRVQLGVSAGLHRFAGLWTPSASLSVRAKWRSRHLFAHAFRSAGQFGQVDTGGWGDYVQKRKDDFNEHTHVRLGVQQKAGVVSAAPYVFRTNERAVTDYQEIEPDVTFIELYYTRTAGVGLRIAFRDGASRGVYGTVSSWTMGTLSGGQENRVGALPKWGGSGHLGVRYLLFAGDLDLNVSLRGFWWGSFRSRILHAPTGLLVLPNQNRVQPLPASGTLDVYAEGGVRGATLFVAWENVLSGTPLMAGNETIATYPLPEQQLRFGVYWPIVN